MYFPVYIFFFYIRWLDLEAEIHSWSSFVDSTQKPIKRPQCTPHTDKYTQSGPYALHGELILHWKCVCCVHRRSALTHTHTHTGTHGLAYNIQEQNKKILACTPNQNDIWRWRICKFHLTSYYLNGIQSRHTLTHIYICNYVSEYKCMHYNGEAPRTVNISLGS